MDSTPDQAIIKALPKGSVLVSTARHGKTNWIEGLKIEVETESQRKAYFVKVTDRDHANEIANGEFHSQNAMKKWIPEHAATPLAVGPLERHLAKAFFMAEFRDLEAEKPSPTVLAGILANLHQSSVSPTGKFGFPVATFKGYVPMNNVWTDSWEEWFTRHFRMDFEQCVRGPDWEIDDELLEQFCTKVIPRLLRPLETGGRTIRPRLYHTDMWHGNVYFDKLTKVPIIFDACCVYGHHEMELGMFHSPRYGWDASYLKSYTDLISPSQPREDFDDRVAIYAIRNHIVSASLWQHLMHMKAFVKDEMERLLVKYPDGYAGFESR